MQIKKIFSIGLIALLVGLSFGVVAQINQETFGKSRVQNRQFDWKFYASDNFELHFYAGGERTARLAIEFLEDEFSRITDIIGYPPINKTRILLYNNFSDMQQSNIGINGTEFDLTGELISNSSYVEIAYTGESESFRKALSYQITRSYIFEMLFSGSSTDFFESAYFLSLPEWFVEGASLYVANGWDIEMDDYVRDFVGREKNIKLSRLKGEEAAIIGQSVWNYIVTRYGLRNMSNVLNLTRIIRNEENSVQNTLGVSFRKFTSDWQMFYAGGAEVVNNSYVPHNKESIEGRPKRNNFLGKEIKLNPEGSKAAYVSFNKGKYAVHLLDIANKKTTTVYTGGKNVLEQRFDASIPVIGWQSNDILAIIDRAKSGLVLNLVTQSGKSEGSIELPQFEHVTEFNFAPDGLRIVMSAAVNGQNDLYLFTPSRNFLRRITNDIFDDRSPRFIPGTNSIVFSSNRLTDSLQTTTRSMQEISDFSSLFVYSLDSTENVLTRITNTLTVDRNPVPINANEIIYASDQRGITNLYKLDINTRAFTQITNYNTSLVSFDVNARRNIYSYLTLQKGDKVALVEEFKLNQTFFSPLTYRQQALQAKLIQERRSDFEESIQTEVSAPARSMVNLEAREGEIVINTESYVFDKQEERQSERPNVSGSILSNLRDRSQGSSRILGPIDFESKFAIDNFQINFIIDPLRGFGPNANVRLSDVLENHTFNAGFYTSLDFSKGGEVFAEYTYRKYRPDFRVRYYRRNIRRDDSEVQHKYVLDQIELLGSYPINNSLSIGLGPFVAQSFFYDQDPRLLSPGLPPNLPNSESNNQYYGLKAEVIFDNAISQSVNIFHGTRAKATFSQFESFDSESLSFSKLKVDIRHYQEIHRDIIFAGRLNYGRFMGNGAKKFLLGGTNNWIFNTINDSDPDGGSDPLANVPLRDNSDILFHEFSTSIRGYDLNSFNGTDFISFNAEIRMPIFSYLSKGPIASNFLRNFQLVGFYDLGSAWSDGKSPFTGQSSQNIEIIRPVGSPFQAVINNFDSPWLQSYGLGARTVLLGYFLRFDLAYPIEQYSNPKPRLFVSLGLDF